MTRPRRHKPYVPRAIQPGQSGVGMPEHAKLELFGELLEDVFGHMPYLVGSASHSKTWRDVDVRVILPDREFTALFERGDLHGGAARFAHSRIGGVTLAFSVLGREMTGLPIDLQIQPMTEANRYDGPRIPIGLAHIIDPVHPWAAAVRYRREVFP